MSTATLSGSIQKPVSTLAGEQNFETFPLSSTLSYSEEQKSTLDLGIVVDSPVPFGTIGSAKLVMIRPDQNISVKINGSATGIPVSGTTDAKGWFLLSNPNGGITGITITTTVNTKIALMLLE